jgi:hypothetical protein
MKQCRSCKKLLFVEKEIEKGICFSCYLGIRDCNQAQKVIKKHKEHGVKEGTKI